MKCFGYSRLFRNPRETISYLDTEDEGEGERQHDQQRGEPGQDESAWPGARGVSWNMMSSGENWIRRVQGVRSNTAVSSSSMVRPLNLTRGSSFIMGLFITALSCCQNVFLGQRLF